MLPWLVFYEEEPGRPPELAGQLTVSGIVGGSASWGQIGYWVDQRLAGRGITPTAVALATALATTLDIPCIAQVNDDADLPLLAALGVTSASGRVAGEAWDAVRLAAEMAERSATRPRP